MRGGVLPAGLRGIRLCCLKGLRNRRINAPLKAKKVLADLVRGAAIFEQVSRFVPQRDAVIVASDVQDAVDDVKHLAPAAVDQLGPNGPASGPAEPQVHPLRQAVSGDCVFEPVLQRIYEMVRYALVQRVVEGLVADAGAQWLPCCSGASHGVSQ